MKKYLLLFIALLVLSASGYTINAKYQTLLARNTLNRLPLAESCHDLESLMSPKLYEALGPCDQNMRFDISDRSVLKAEVESCVHEDYFTKEGKEFTVEDDGGYSIAFKCVAPKEEGGGTNYVLLKQVGSTYQIVNMTSHSMR